MKPFLLACFICMANAFAYAQNTREDSLKKSLDLHPKEDTIRVNLFYRFGYPPMPTNLEIATKEIQEGINLAERLNWGKGQARGLFLLAYLQNVSQQFDLAIASGLNSLKISEAIKDSSLMALVNSFLGAVYGQWGNDSLAEYHLKKALEIANKINDKTQILSATLRLIDFYDDHNLWDKAAKYLAAGLRNSIEQHEESLESSVLFEIADGQYHAHNYMKGIEYLRQALILGNHQNDYHGIAFNYACISRGFCYLKNKDSAYYYANAALQLSKKYNLAKELSDSYEILFTVATTFHNYRTALNYRLILDSLQNKTYSIQTAQRIERAIVKADQDKKDEAARTEQEIKDAETKRIRNLQYSAIATFLLVAILLFWNNRQKQKAKTKIQIAYTALKSAQSQLIHSEKMASLGELTAGIAHEIQNPLNFVNNFSEVNGELIEEMQQELDKGNLVEARVISSEISENEEKINHHGKRADAIVKSMLQHSRSSSGLKELTDINALAEEYLRLSYHGLRAKDNSFQSAMESHFDNAIRKINVIPQDIGRVLLNLYNNAFYAVSEKKNQQPDGYEPTVSVATKKVADKVMISVRDNGNGIPQKVIDKIFQPFFTTKPTGQGTGLGLSLSYDIVKAHGGEITANTKEGEYTEFTVQLPIS